MNVLRLVSLTAVLCLAAFMTATGDDGPINTVCPLMKGKPLRPGVTSVYEGVTIGFCCNKCKAQFDLNPKKCAEKMPEFQAAMKKPKPLEVGQKVAPFKLKNTDSKDISLSDYKGKIVVFEWINPKSAACLRVCSSGVVTKMVADLKAIKDDVVFLPINSADTVDGKAVAKYLTDNKIEAKGVLDPGGALAKAFGVTVTPQCYVVDGEGVVRYAGAIDDDADGKKADKAVNYVVAAVKALAGGGKIETETTKPYGEEIPVKK